MNFIISCQNPGDIETLHVLLREALDEEETASVWVARTQRIVVIGAQETFRNEIQTIAVQRNIVASVAINPPELDGLQPLPRRQLTQEEIDEEFIGEIGALRRQNSPVTKVKVALPKPREVSMIDPAAQALLQTGRRRPRTKEWLLIRDHTWEFVQQLNHLLTRRMIGGSGMMRCLELLQNNGWLSKMELHVFGAQRTIMFVLEEEIRKPTEEDPDGEKAILYLDPGMITVNASFELGKVRVEPKLREDFPSEEDDGEDEEVELVGELRKAKPKEQGPTIVKTNHPATLEFWLRQTPFTLFHE